MVLTRSPALRAAVAKAAFSSKYGPVLKSQPHIKGLPLWNLRRYGTMVVGLGAAAGTALLFLAEDIPVVRKDIFLNIPIIGSYWEKNIAPEDNPF